MGATYVRQGDHQVGHWPNLMAHIVVFAVLLCYDPNSGPIFIYQTPVYTIVIRQVKVDLSLSAFWFTLRI